MRYERTYDEHGQLQCRGCGQFKDDSRYYRRSDRHLCQSVCKDCQRASETATQSRARAKERYHTDPEFRDAHIGKTKEWYTNHRERVRARCRARYIANKYRTKKGGD